MSFIKEYAEKLVTAEEAVKVVKSGDWLDYGWCSATARELDKALAAHVVENDLVDLKIRGGILMWVPEIFKIENPAHERRRKKSHCPGLRLLHTNPLLRNAEILQRFQAGCGRGHVPGRTDG